MERSGAGSSQIIVSGGQERMINVRRLMAVSAVLGVAAVLTCADAWGGAGRFKDWLTWRQAAQTRNKAKAAAAPAKEDARFGEELEQNRFADRPLIAYSRDGSEALFALQVRPGLPDAVALPTDFLVVVDTSAAQ